ncbi:DUF4880 domain-containing protein [Sandaracinobacter sp. RS1-74]|nr:DUF4880 domain-containing protein [Sandaracinobacteroides sayramensis]
MTPRTGLEQDVAPLKLEAMDWAARFAIGPVTDDDRAAFERWRRCSPAHGEAYRVAAGFLEELHALDLPSALPARAGSNDNGAARAGDGPAIGRRAFLRGGAVAAGVAAGVVATQSPLGLWPTLGEMLADERTGPGERRKLSPMAGVDIEMNARSSLSLSGAGMRLVSGEIFVAVDKPDTPLRVRARDASVVARSARFNVNALDTELCVTCLEGSLTTARDQQDVRLGSGQAIAWRRDGGMRRTDADPETATAWRRGLLVFNGTPLASAVSEINRHFPGRLVLRGSGLESRTVTGVFHVNQIELAVVQIQQLTGVGATRLPGGVVLLG